MNEHRTIERMVIPIKKEIARIKSAGKVNTELIDITVDFIRTYADRCHHGKEEGILFRALSKKNMSEKHAAIMKELIQEHVFARTTTHNLEKATVEYVNGNSDAINDVCRFLNDLAQLYPEHIEKEDKIFFPPSMEYFTPQEQAAMLQEFGDFDRRLIHKKYREVAERLEQLAANPQP